jgi:hypothetical protein
MSSHSFRVVVIILVVSAMTTCLSLYLSTSSRKFATEFGSRSRPQKRLRHTFEAIKNSKADIPNVDFRLVIHGRFSAVRSHTQNINLTDDSNTARDLCKRCD